jgi:hypothetical protein
MTALASFLTEEYWIFRGWQIIPAVLLIVIIIFWVQYRKRQV